MKIHATITLMLALVMASCNLPVSPGMPTATFPAPEDIIATAVAASLTPLGNPPTTQAPAGPTEQQGQPTNTPTATPQASPTSESTATPEISLTPTITATPDDITAGLGQPAYKDTFDSSGGFFQKGVTSAEDDYTKFSVANGKLTLSSFGAPFWMGWRLTSQKQKNLYLEAAFTTGACTGLDQYGLVIRAPNYDSGYGYYLAFACNGSYRFFRWDDNGNVALTNWSANTLINAGANQTNRMGIWASNNTFRLFANGKLLQEISDGNISDSGHIGCFITFASTKPFTVEMDNFTYWTVP